MKNKRIIGILILLITIVTASLIIFYYYDGNSSPNSATSSNNYVLGSNEYGKVIKEGPYGNKDSDVKIAYIIGVHPLESDSHKAIFNSIEAKNNSLKYCYYIYKVIVSKDANDYDKGRMNGQLLANQYVVPDIKDQNFNLAIDIHSNRGNYKTTRFIFAPQDEVKSKAIALSIKSKVPWLVYYNPPSQTSPKYVTIPLIDAGIPAVIYETYINDPYALTKDHANKFISIVDDIQF